MLTIFLAYLVPRRFCLSHSHASSRYWDCRIRCGSLILVYPSFTVPFCTWLLMGFFKAIPEDVDMNDGLSRFGAFIKVVMPISIAGKLTAVIFAFTLVTQ